MPTNSARSGSSPSSWRHRRAAAPHTWPARLRPDPRRFGQAQGFFARFGWPSLLLAWLPVIGDPLTLVAGTLNYPLGRFVLLVFTGKAARYAVLWAGWSALA